MSEIILGQEPVIRLVLFAVIFLVLAASEAHFPRRVRSLSRWRRWPGNIGISALNTVFIRLVFPATAVAFAGLAETRGWGLLQLMALPETAKIILAIIILDLIIYLQHVLFHAVPLLWRLHRMHHADPDFDVTTGSRFHPVEIMLSMGIKLMVIAALGAPAIAVLIFEIVLNGASMFNHANLKLPLQADRMLRRFIVTPDMHRVHHSIIPSETNSNFGFNVPWWDHLFGTYRSQPKLGHEAMTIGIGQFQSARGQRLDQMLVQPFLGGNENYPIGR
ncbi:MAG TPA: sterol desaturase family protein [Alphaproteobacteria bacterium]|nr:sterol desaturase family protein [Alphaproteobacteria bacterium]